MILTDNKLKEIILAAHLLDEKSWNNIVEFAKNSDISLTDALIEKDIVPDETFGALIAKELNLPFVTLSKISIPEDVFPIIPERIARKQKVIAFGKEGNIIKLAMNDPRNQELQQMVAKKTGCQVAVYFASERDIFNTLHIYKKDLQKRFDNLLSDVISKSSVTVSDDAPIAKIVDLLMETAYQEKASDIHIESEEKNSLVRFRIDGILHDVLIFPNNLHERIITRIKILAKLRTDEHLAPQDGKIRMKLDEENIDLHQASF